MSKQQAWDERYAASELVWGREPNRFVAEAFAESAPAGRALDLACGEGRNAIWLAQRGWRVTGVDFSAVAVARAGELAARAREEGDFCGEVDFVAADVTQWKPEAGAYALVLIAYLQIPRAQQTVAWRHAASALAPGGELFAIGHALRNLGEGTGGPQDPDVLWELRQIAKELEALGLEGLSHEERPRPVEGADRDAIDALIRARRPR